MAPDSYLVTGGEGFLGHRMIEMLKERYPTASVTSTDLTQRHEPTGHRFISCDLTDKANTLAAVRQSGASIVFHVAAGLISLPKDILQKVNIEGTENVIEACKSCKVQKLIYTCTSGVVFDGQDLINVDERLPVVEQEFHDPYMFTKATAEKMIISANGVEGLLTCSIRPAGIFGAGDWLAGPGMIQVYKEGKTRFQLGSNNNLFDFTYVDNVVHAHLLAAARLGETVSTEDLTRPLPAPPASSAQTRSVPTSHYRPSGQWDEGEQPPASSGSDDIDAVFIPPRNRYDQFFASFARPDEAEPIPVAGQVYFISNNEPVYFWDMPRMMWAAYAQHTPSSYIVFPKSIAYVLGSVVGWINSMLGKPETFTRGKCILACADKYHNTEKARRMLGYEPIVGLEEGVQKFVEWYKTVENDPNRRQHGMKAKAQ